MDKVKEEFRFWLPNYQCLVCGREISTASYPNLCARCTAKLPLMPEQLPTHYSPLIYAPPVTKLILQLKYHSNGLVAINLAPLMAAVLMPVLANCLDPVLVPVPLFRGRQRLRGYNQSLLLAQELSKLLKIPVNDQVLVRTKKTVIQKHMDAAARAANLQGAFSVDHTAPSIQGRSVILVDDVYTTGATTQECRRVLLHYGARTVTIVTLATVVP